MYTNNLIEKINEYFIGWIKYVILFNIIVFLIFKVFKYVNLKKFIEFGEKTN